ncbi:hypothetical protein EPO15_03290 [bacterium]|nr:MAG: hypothetical protein EPO15_03290 [bacterium]
MADAGPPLERLTRRLSECPSEFLAEPLEQGVGEVDVAAVVGDLLAALGGEPLDAARAQRLLGTGGAARRNRLGLVLVSAWLLHDECFRGRGLGAAAEEFLAAGLAAPARAVRFSEFVSDADRREELARLALRALGLAPEGETPAQAVDRLAALDSVETARTAAQSKAHAQRLRSVMDAMRKKAAEEAAARVCRE